MEIKSELDIFLERELLKAVSLYGAKTGASGVGEFILEDGLQAAVQIHASSKREQLAVRLAL